MADIVLSAVSKSFGAALAVDALSMDVPSGTFLALLGPSGCGKTTILRLIAGLERPDDGALSIGGRVVADASRFVEPEDRGLGMVFQSYALWPHMSVAGNVAFGLEVRRLSRAERSARVEEALDLVGLSAFADRRPHELSGGQRQRVALARSLAVRPPLILLDEPLANLDMHLRETMQAEFRRIHRQAGTTFVLVTHDQSEAMAMADIVAVIDRGRLQQLGTPQALFQQPASAMVARFIAQGRTLAIDVLAGAEQAPGRRAIRLQDKIFEVQGSAPPGPGWLCVRAQDLELLYDPVDSREGLRALIVDQRFEAGDYRLSIAFDGLDEAGLAEVRSSVPCQVGAPIGVALKGGWVLARHLASLP